MRFHPRINSSMSKRQGWNFTLGWKKENNTSKCFIPGWSFKMSMFFFFNFWWMDSNIMGTSFFQLGGQRDHTRKKLYIFDYELLRHWRDCNSTRNQNHLFLNADSTIWVNWLVAWLYWVFNWLSIRLGSFGLESSWSHFTFRFPVCFEQGVPWHSGNYGVWIHSETRTWHDKDIHYYAILRIFSHGIFADLFIFCYPLLLGCPHKKNLFCYERSIFFW